MAKNEEKQKFATRPKQSVLSLEDLTALHHAHREIAPKSAHAVRGLDWTRSRRWASHVRAWSSTCPRRSRGRKVARDAENP
jgi:hypothetical protein